jgi:hypothetical protein
MIDTVDSLRLQEVPIVGSVVEVVVEYLAEFMHTETRSQLPYAIFSSVILTSKDVAIAAETSLDRQIDLPRSCRR